MAEVDQSLQKILYREFLVAEPKVGILNTLTYGILPASFIITKCLHVWANEIASSNHVAAEVIRKDFYMDDLITSCDSVAEAIALNYCIKSTLLSAKFPLQKYVSNSTEFLKFVDPNLVEHNTSKTFEIEIVKLLGIWWTTQNDKLSVSLVCL